MSLGGRPLLSYALTTCRAHPAVDEIILVVAPDDMERAAQLIVQGPARVTEKVVCGGAERRDSVWHGLQEVAPGTAIVLIHDAARPFLSRQLISACIAAAQRHGAAVVAMPIADTLKQAAEDGIVTATVPRDRLWGAQTPQGFKFPLLFAAYQQAVTANWTVTDDASVVERAGHRVCLVEGETMNFKITRPSDQAMAERMLGSGMRVGFGYDVHRLVANRALVLGGVTVPHSHGLLGHSDADVLIHAIMDALLGAAALGDIGQHFPDTDPRYLGSSSRGLLTDVVALLHASGYTPTSIDATLVAQAPRLAPFIPAMQACLAATLGLRCECVSVKATTTEGLGFVGEGAGIAAYATACLAAWSSV